MGCTCVSQDESFAPSFSCDQGLLEAHSYGALALSFCPIQVENQFFFFWSVSSWTFFFPVSSFSIIGTVVFFKLGSGLFGASEEFLAALPPLSETAT